MSTKGMEDNYDRACAKDEELRPIVKWLDEEALSSIYTSQYWNDLSAEQSKEWWIADGGEAAFERLRASLDEVGLMAEYRIAEDYIAKLPRIDLNIADLASGIGWTSSQLSKLPNVASVHAVEISQHRLELLFPQAVRLFKGEAVKLSRNLGSFYNLQFAGSSMDIVFLSSAFHHASDPSKLLTEIDRVLKPGGALILIGEVFIGRNHIFRRILKKLLLERKYCTNFHELFPPDQVLGDHYYRVGDYNDFFQMVNYKVVKYSVQNNQTCMFIAEKPAA
jgi:ubiquinone/menaquinone biosynthesis C-methylase UbiE